MKVPKRLIQIYEMADGPELWDIGCDHSLLAEINSKRGRFSKVYCVDKSKSSLEKILKSSSAIIDSSKTILVHADGCDLEWAKVSGSVVIAGVGGHTVLKVVRSCPEPYRQRLTWIMNPFTSVDIFLNQITSLLPAPSPQGTDVLENGRHRIIYKWAPKKKYAL